MHKKLQPEILNNEVNCNPIKRNVPSFEEAKNGRQKVRAAGPNPDYWYPVAWDKEIKPGQIKEIHFWKDSIALFRGSDGKVHAVENRCAHRQIKLSLGSVNGCQISCAYHGWTYDGAGRLTSIPHEMFGRSLPPIGIRSYPIQIRYGLIWLFPGDPKLKDQRTLPDMPELESKKPWASIAFDKLWKTHFSIALDNMCDLTHGYVHRKYRPFSLQSKLTRLEIESDGALLNLLRSDHLELSAINNTSQYLDRHQDYKIHVGYDAKKTANKIFRALQNQDKFNFNLIDICFDYPYFSDRSGSGKFWLWFFISPINETTTRVFFLSYTQAMKIPFTSISFPKWMEKLMVKLVKKFYLNPLFEQDRLVVEAEQEAYDKHFNESFTEINPVVRILQEIIIHRWKQHLTKT